MLKQILRNIVFSYAQLATQLLAPLLLIPLYLRFLGHENYGEWLVMTAVVSYFDLLRLGVPQTLVNKVAEERGGVGEHEAAGFVSSVFFFFAAVGIVIAALLLCSAPWLSRVLRFEVGPARSALKIFSILSAVALPLSVFSLLLRGRERVDLERAACTIGNLAELALVAYILFGGFGLRALAVVEGGLAVATGGLCFLWARRVAPDALPRWSQFSLESLRVMAWPSFGFLLIQLSGILLVRLDSLVIVHYLGPGSVTQYTVAYSLIFALTGVFYALLEAVGPSLTVQYSRDRDSGPLAAAFLFSMRLSVLYAGVAAIGLATAGPEFLRLWAGSGVYPGGATFGLQITYLAVMVTLSIPYNVLISTTRHHTFAALALFEGILNLVLSLWWVREWGLAGVIGGSVVARMLTLVWYLPLASVRVLAISVRDFIGGLLPILALAGVAMIAALWTETHFGLGGSFLGSTLNGGAWCALLGVAFWRLSLTIEERTWLAQRISKCVTTKRAISPLALQRP